MDSEAGADPAVRQGDEADLPDIVRSLRGTGSRIGEVLAIRRDAVDLDAGVVEINATVVRITGRGSALQDRAKSDAGWRVIAIPPELVELWRARLDLVHPRFPAVRALAGSRAGDQTQARDDPAVS